MTTNDESSLDEQAKEDNDQNDTHEAKLFCNHCQQKIGMSFRQVEQFFNAGAQTNTKHLAASESNKRMRKLVAAPEGVRPRVHETEDTVATVRRNNDQHGKRGHQHDDQDGKQARPHPSQEEDADGDRNDHHESTKIRLLEQKDADHHHGARHRQEGLLQIMHVRHLAHRIVGGVQHGEQLHQFGRLQIRHAERQPATRAIDVTSNARNQYQRQQYETGDEEPGRHLLPGRERHLEGEPSGHQPDGQEYAVADEIIGRMVSGKTPSLSNGNRRRIDHHHADQQQNQTAPQEGQIHFGGHPAGSVERGQHQTASLSRSRTALMNTSAR